MTTSRLLPCPFSPDPSCPDAHAPAGQPRPSTHHQSVIQRKRDTASNATPRPHFTAAMRVLGMAATPLRRWETLHNTTLRGSRFSHYLMTFMRCFAVLSTTLAVMTRLCVQDLLNPAPTSSTPPPRRVNASADLRAPLGTVSHTPAQTTRALVTRTHQLPASFAPAPSVPPPRIIPPPPPPLPLSERTPRRLQPNSGRTVEYGVHIADKSSLSALYRYAPGIDLAYPESGLDAPVGHLLPINPADPALPWVDLAYSTGYPHGGSGRTQFFFTNLLVDDAGVPVPCKKRHSTCQGVKACPLNDVETLTGPAHHHTSATLEDIEVRLAADRAARQRLSCPRRDVLVKTASFITAIRTVGCHRPHQQPTHRTGEELKQWEADQAQKQYFRRGYRPPPMCEGRIVYHEYADPKYPDGRPRAYLSCEHYSRRSPDHFAHFGIQDGGLDEEYIAAVFLNNTDEIARIEAAAAAQEVGPLAQCNTLLNHSAQTLYCPIDHRVDGRLARHELCHLDCAVKFRIWFPVDKHRCPFVLVTSSGTHRHPIPLPEKTPQRAHLHITRLLRSLRHDLPDMTPRRFLRHPTVKTFLANLFPDLANPTLCALHPSLANRAHLGAYITLARQEHFPRGTDWEGVKYLKAIQDRDVPAHEHYIRVVLELPDDSLDHHEEDDDAPTSSKTTRIIICMTPDSSKRLQQARYLQSDIGFKRIVGFDEFEIAAMDRDANKSVVFCRVYLTRQTAAAHQRIFDELSKIVEKDTGTPLLWRHLHGQTPDDCRVGLILQWGADQHRGQAKGLGLHLVARAAQLPADAMDMHEPHRSLRSLTPYEHLQRVYRVCRVHNFRNIQQCAVPEVVRQKMCSLACEIHPNWENTLEQIRREGGRAGLDWVRDKESSQFAFAGICWQRSFIPIDVWRAGDAHTNLIETVHRDVNREGVHCTLLGGLLRGQDYDEMQRVALREYEAHGIHRSYHAAHPVTNAVKNVIRRSNNQAHRVEAQSRGVATHNKNMQKFDQQYRAALKQLEHLLRLVDAPHLRAGEAQRAVRLQIENAKAAVRSASAKYDHQVQVGQQLRDEGRAGVMLPKAP
ncbi:hypothetical protein DFH06DRAFT_1316251 [Mycena polygramma]|nr:hypothetical protein DFH06DRAFT_1316251 [Mycena polygramma]